MNEKLYTFANCQKCHATNKVSIEKIDATSLTLAANFSAMGSINIPNWVAKPAIIKLARKLMAVKVILLFIMSFHK